VEIKDWLMIVGYFIGMIPGIIALRRSNVDIRKTQADTGLAKADEADKISEAWSRLNQPNKDAIDMLEKQLSTTRDSLSRAFVEIQELQEQNRLKDIELGANAEKMRQNAEKMREYRDGIAALTEQIKKFEPPKYQRKTGQLPDQ
jgi:chromosome segregation ATPase